MRINCHIFPLIAQVEEKLHIFVEESEIHHIMDELSKNTVASLQMSSIDLERTVTEAKAFLVSLKSCQVNAV